MNLKSVPGLFLMSVLGLLLAGCSRSWPAFRHDARRTGNQLLGRAFPTRLKSLPYIMSGHSHHHLRLRPTGRRSFIRGASTSAMETAFSMP